MKNLRIINCYKQHQYYSSGNLSKHLSSNCINSKTIMFQTNHNISFSISTLFVSKLFLLLCVTNMCKGSNLQIQTDKGVVQGSTQGQTIKYLGIPYATAKRFQFPNTNLPRWNKPFNATDFAPSCSQACSQSRADCPKQMEEECLTLNIYRPTTIRKGRTYPVILFLHGGDFSSGSSASAIYDGNYFSFRGRIIVVTLNYRLGAFGFLSIFDKYGEAMGNFGLRDQQAAMFWIQNNIEYFGGDPTKVTLMGAGSGCVSAVTHLASMNSQSMFQSAILQSCPLNVPFRSKEQAQLQSDAFAKFLDCNVNNVTCYREKTVEDILQAQLTVGASTYSSNQLMSFYPWGPSIDNSEVFYNPLEIFADLGRFADKPIVIGTVADEGISFVFDKFPLPLSLYDFNAFLSSSVTNYRPITLAPPGGDMRELLAKIIKDYVFICPAQYAAQQIAQKQKLNNQNSNKAWVYEFTKPTRLPSLNSNKQSTQQQIAPLRSPWRPVSLSERLCQTKSCHGSDVRTLFNSNSLPYIERLINEPLTRRMIQYLSNFARRGNVNGAITSRTHLRSLQMRSLMMPISDPSSSFMSSSRTRSRNQRYNFRPFGVRDSTHFVPATTSSLLSALKAFTFWPPYSTPGQELESVMVLQSPVLVSNSSHFGSRCSGFLNSKLGL